jgi:hypothetical protein
VHGQPWWNDIDRRKLICPLELFGNSTSHLVAKQEELAKEMTFVHEISLSCIEGFFNML